MAVMARSYCYGNPEQIASLDSLEIETMYDLFDRVERYCGAEARPGPDATTADAVFRRHLVRFLRSACRGVFVDFESLKLHRVATFGGRFPNQWIGLPRRRGAHAPRRALAPTPAVAGAASERRLWLAYNGEFADEAAAVRAAVQLSAASPPVDAPVASAARGGAEDADEPVELCCPISMQLMRDPVKTASGQTYDRASIAEWFAKRRTDPMTGQELDTLELHVDAAMAHRLREHRRCAHRRRL